MKINNVIQNEITTPKFKFKILLYFVIALFPFIFKNVNNLLLKNNYILFTKNNSYVFFLITKNCNLSSFLHLSFKY